MRFPILGSKYENMKHLTLILFLITATATSAQISTAELKKSIGLFEEILQNETCVQGEIRWTDDRWYLTSGFENCISNQQDQSNTKVEASTLKKALKKSIAYISDYSEILPGDLSFKYTVQKEKETWSIKIWNGLAKWKE